MNFHSQMACLQYEIWLRLLSRPRSENDVVDVDFHNALIKEARTAASLMADAGIVTMTT